MIELRYFEPADFEQLIDWVETPEFMIQWAGPSFIFPLNEFQLKEYLKDANQENSTALIYSAVQKDTDKLIGHISLANIDRNNRSARVGRVLVGEKGVRGQGIGGQMIHEILKIAFDELQLHRVSLGVFDFNKSAISCYEKEGFKKEGLLRDYRKMNEDFWSLWEMSILENEWMDQKNR